MEIPRLYLCLSVFLCMIFGCLSACIRYCRLFPYVFKSSSLVTLTCNRNKTFTSYTVFDFKQSSHGMTNFRCRRFRDHSNINSDLSNRKQFTTTFKQITLKFHKFFQGFYLFQHVFQLLMAAIKHTLVRSRISFSTCETMVRLFSKTTWREWLAYTILVSELNNRYCGLNFAISRAAKTVDCKNKTQMINFA